jgi:hypothetical protein
MIRIERRGYRSSDIYAEIKERSEKDRHNMKKLGGKITIDRVWNLCVGNMSFLSRGLAGLNPERDNSGTMDRG